MCWETGPTAKLWVGLCLHAQGPNSDTRPQQGERPRLGVPGTGRGGAASALSPHPDLGINYSHPASNVPPGSSYSQILIPLLGTGLVLGLGVVGWACWRRR